MNAVAIIIVMMIVIVIDAMDTHQAPEEGITRIVRNRIQKTTAAVVDVMIVIVTDPADMMIGNGIEIGTEREVVDIARREVIGRGADHRVGHPRLIENQWRDSDRGNVSASGKGGTDGLHHHVGGRQSLICTW